MIILFIDVYKMGFTVDVFVICSHFVIFILAGNGFWRVCLVSFWGETDIRRNSIHMMDNFGPQKFIMDNFRPTILGLTRTHRHTDRQTLNLLYYKPIGATPRRGFNSS